LAGTYQVKVTPVGIDNIPLVPTDYTLTLSPCVITPSSHGTEKYIVGDSAMVVTFTQFIIFPTSCSLEYTLDIPTAISQAVTGDISTLSFTVQTLD